MFFGVAGFSGRFALKVTVFFVDGDIIIVGNLHIHHCVALRQAIDIKIAWKVICSLHFYIQRIFKTSIKNAVFENLLLSTNNTINCMIDLQCAVAYLPVNDSFS